MEVLAVSAALPKWHDINGKSTLTSIVRKPLQNGIIRVHQTGIEHNDTALHDGPVYAFFAQHYEYWCKKLNIERGTWDWCHWGENITFKCDGTVVSEEDFHLGDIWQVGDSVRLQVCGARIPCFKLSWRCGQNDSWLKALADSGRCGVYFQVIQAGEIHVGDKARMLEKRMLDTVDCATITRTAFDGSPKRRRTVDLLAQSTLLLEMQRTIFERKLSTIKAEERDGRNAWPGWRRFIPYKVVSEGSNMKSFYLKPLDGGPLATYAPGQFLTIKLPTGDVRSWSISDWPQDPGAPEYYRITIKRAQTASVWMIAKSTEDTVLEVRSPKGGFVLDQKTLYPPRQVYLSAGVGITPLIAMLKAHKSHVSLRHTPAIWIHVCRNGDDLPCKDDLEKLPSALKRVWCFTTPLAHETFKKHYDIRGRPNMQLLENLISGKYEMSIRPGGKSMQIDGSMSVFYICGPTTFKEATKVSLTRLGVSDSLIRSEQFASDGIPEIPDLEHAVVRFTKSKVEAEWTKDQPCTILELAERAGLKPDSGCRVGMCGSCSSRLICGTVAGGLQLDGSVYICQARPSVPEVEIEM